MNKDCMAWVITLALAASPFAVLAACAARPVAAPLALGGVVVAVFAYGVLSGLQLVVRDILG